MSFNHRCSQVFFYSTSLFTNVIGSETKARYATSAVGAIMVTMTIVTIPLMDRLGRRTLHLTGLGGMAVFSILVTVTLALQVCNVALKITTA